MPVPVLLGIPWLATTIIGAFAGLVTWFATFLTKRVAIAVALAVGLLIIVGGFIAAIQALVATISIGWPWIYTGYELFLPSNLSQVVGIWMSARLIAWVYHWNIKLFHIKLAAV